MASSKNKEFKQLLPALTRFINHFSPEINKRKLLIVGSFAALLIETGFRLLEPWPLKFIFDKILVPNPSEVHFIFGYNFDTFSLLTLLALSIVAIAIIEGSAAYLSTFGMALAAIQILSEIRGNLYSHLQRLSISFHHKHKSGDLITRVTADIDHIRIAIVKTALPFLTNIVALVGMFGVMLWMNWELTLIGLTIFPVFVFLLTRLLSNLRQVSRKHRKYQGILASTTSETIAAVKVIQALSIHGLLENIFFEQNNKTLDQSAQSLKLSALLQKTVHFLVAVTIALVLWRGSNLALQKTLTPGDLLVFITYLRNAFEPLRKLSNQASEIVKASASAERIMDVLNYEPHVRNYPGSRPAHPLCGAVRFENVFFDYDSQTSILNNISFEVQPGQKVAIVGPSGSGKSTLTSLLLRLYDPTSGRILIDGQNLREYTLESLRQQISVVLQDSILFAVSVRENIAYGKVGASDKEVERAAKLANAHDFILNLSDGYETVLSERGGTLSGGQRQRIAIARAAIRQAPIVILDEPTTGLDNASEQIVTATLKKLCQAKTTFLITHNLKTAEDADLILYLEKGEILERGTHKQLMHLASRYAALYQLQNAVNSDYLPGDNTYAFS